MLRFFQALIRECALICRSGEMRLVAAPERIEALFMNKFESENTSQAAAQNCPTGFVIIVKKESAKETETPSCSAAKERSLKEQVRRVSYTFALLPIYFPLND